MCFVRGNATRMVSMYYKGLALALQSRAPSGREDGCMQRCAISRFAKRSSHFILFHLFLSNHLVDSAYSNQFTARTPALRVQSTIPCRPSPPPWQETVRLVRTSRRLNESFCGSGCEVACYSAFPSEPQCPSRIQEARKFPLGKRITDWKLTVNRTNI